MEKGIARYLFELGQLKRVKRSGWWVAGVDQPESVADHSFRCAAIAYVLAELEGANPERAATIALFHDTGETRVNDQHRVGKTYVDWSGAEEKVVEDQLQRLHQAAPVQLPNIVDLPLYSLSPQLPSQFFQSLTEGYPGFDAWFERKAQEGRRAWVSWEQNERLGGIFIYAQQENERITEDVTLHGSALKISTFKVAELAEEKIGELFLKAAFRYAGNNGLNNLFVHGDVALHHFLFEMLEDFGFTHIGFHPGSDGWDAVYLKAHPEAPPKEDLPPFEYARRYFPHFRHDGAVSKFVIPVRPEYHRILFPDYDSPADRQMTLFQPS